MGYISKLAETKGIAIGDSGIGIPRSPTDRGEGRALWRRIFGTDKESGSSVVQPIPGGSHSRSIVSGGPAQKRLLQAMRSMAPGGWSDDRWEQTKHFVGIAYVGIDRTCRQLQQAEFKIYYKDSMHPDGKRPVMPNDPPHGNRFVRPYQLVELLEKPNKQDSFGKMMYRWGQQLKLTGTALTWMVPNKLDIPMELYPIPTAIAIPQPAINPDFPDGYYRIQPVYPYGPFSSYPTPSTAVGAPIPAQWMLRFVYPHPLLRYDGYSPMTGGRLQLDEVEGIDRSRFYSMKRTTNPSAVMYAEDAEGFPPGGLPEPEIERIHAEWENEMQGPENAGKLVVGSPGWKIEQWGSAPKDMDYPAGWDQLTSFCLGGIFGITKPAAGMVEDSSYATLFATLKQLNLISIQPDCDDIASYLTRHLAPFFGEDLIVEIKAKRIDDHDITNAKIDKGIAAKSITKNEVRKMLEMPVTAEEWGNDIAGDPSQAEKEQQEQQQKQEQMMAQQQAAEKGKGKEPPPKEEEKMEPKEVTATKPQPGNLGRGALGPKDMIHTGKSFYRRMEVLCNGHV